MSPTATSPRPSGRSSSPTAPATCSTPATPSPAPAPPTVVVLLVDVRHGLQEQTRRHLAVASLLRVPHVIVVVNKIDLVDFDEETYDRVSDEVLESARSLGLYDVATIPVSALDGDNVVDRSRPYALV